MQRSASSIRVFEQSVQLHTSSVTITIKEITREQTHLCAADGRHVTRNKRVHAAEDSGGEGHVTVDRNTMIFALLNELGLQVLLSGLQHALIGEEEVVGQGRVQRGPVSVLLRRLGQLVQGLS